MIAGAEKFFAHYLGGRYQEDMTPEVATRLKEITVDPKTVVLARKVDAGAVGVPKVAASLTPGTYKYKATLQMGGQSIPLTLATDIKDDNGAWMVTDRMGTPMGEATDVATLDKNTLVLRKRSTHQGPAVVELTFQDNKAAGSMKVNGQDKPVAADLGGELFADSAGAAQVIACLPLAAGYSTSFRNFDVQKQKVKIMQLRVIGPDKVTVPAGTFDALQAEVVSAEGGSGKETLWIAMESRKPVKIAAVIPEMNGAVLTAELTE